MLKLTDTEKQIANALIYAQISSDAGKERYDLEGMDANKTKAAKILGYDSKGPMIEKALNLIRRENTIFSYYVIYDKDQNGAMSYIVYFEFDDENGDRMQISFHIPKGEASEYIRSLEGTGRETEWNGVNGGSAATCEYLLTVLKENEDENGLIK